MTGIACRKSTTSRRLPAAATVLALVAALLWPLPAAALEPTPWTDLRDTMGGCTGTTTPSVVTLPQDIEESGGTLTVDCVAVLDLGGHHLTVANVVINANLRLTIRDSIGGGSLTAITTAGNTAGIRTTGATLIIESGTVTATGGTNGAGIGGDNQGAAGALTVSGGTVTATGGYEGAGIGGGRQGAGGPVTVSDGTVTARGIRAAGIGGGYFGAAGPVTVSGGTVTATGGTWGAGIGGGYFWSGGVVTISGGTVTATGGNTGAGIGGGIDRHGGTVNISGGTVTASGGNNAAGIGGGSGTKGAGATVTLSGGTVTAIGGAGAAGVGGGYLGAGRTVNMGAGAVLSARGGHTAIGAGQGSSSFGSLAVAGTLRLPPGNMIIPSGIVVPVAETGQILGGIADPTVGANVIGGGHIANGGAITLAAARVTGGGVTVSGHHHLVTFDAAGGTPAPADVTVFAPSFEVGQRDFPADPTREGGLAFRGWTDQPDGAGTPIDATTTLPGSSSNGVPVSITAYALWGPAADVTTSTITADPTSITANGASTSTITVQARDTHGHNLTAHGDTVTLATTAGTLSGVTDNDDGTYTATLTSAQVAGTATINGTLNGTKIDDGATVTFTAVPSPTPAYPGPSDPTPTNPKPDVDPVAPVFDDVSEDSAHADAVNRIVRYGITVGASETTFDPSGNLSRGQMATFLVRLLTLTDPNIEQPTDHDVAMALLVERGLLLGDANGNLNGAGTLTREQAASLLVRLLEHATGDVLAPSGTPFSDVPATNTHAENIAKLAGLGVIKGYEDGTLRPGTELRRDQMASLISRALDVLIASGHVEDLDT